MFLNLGLNSIGTLSGSPFQDLFALRTLHIFPRTIFEGIPITPSSFVGLRRLRNLLIQVADYSTHQADPFFIHLSSLQKLNLFVSSTCLSQNIFTGLNNLEYLSVQGRMQQSFDCPFVDICSLISLQSLTLKNCEFVLTNRCSPAISVSYLELESKKQQQPLSFNTLNRLINLTWTTDKPINAAIRSIDALDSPLTNITLTTRSNTHFTLSSSTFESWRVWKQSLQVLIFDLPFGTDISVDGSPFKWFRNLRTLSITGNVRSSIRTLPNIVFQGLSNLQELHLNYLNIQVLSSGVLHTFSSFDTLKVLDLAHNLITEQDGLHEIWNISSLEKINLSYNKIDILSLNPTCGLPNLTTLQTENQNVPDLSGILLKDICTAAPQLNVLDAENNFVFCGETVLCSNITAFHFTGSRCLVLGIIYAPDLKHLFLGGLTYVGYYTHALHLLYLIESSQLRTVDMSSNQISVINKEDAILMRNLTYLDLRNNLLTSLGTLQHLSGIQILLLGGNKITVVPKSFFSNNPSLTTLDIRDNSLVCDCSVEDLRNWILTDEMIYLWNNDSEGTHYTCAAPDSEKGLSITEVELYCESPLLKITLASAFCVTLTVVAIVIIVRFRWHIRYRLFLLLNRRKYQNYLINNDDAHEDDENEDGFPRYDAYVIYHRENEDWVDEQLVANIEEGDEPFRLCLRTRDVRAGRLIFNELSLRIQRSRKVLVILSPYFVDDNWCYFELNMAHHRVLEENRNVLIFIQLEDIPDNRMTLLLRQLFCRVQCLKWPAGGGCDQRLFWRRLREELKRPVPLDRRFNI